MEVTGATIAAAVNALREAGAAPDVAVAATHGLFVGTAEARLGALRIRHFIVSDSVARPSSLPLPVEIVSVAPLLAEAVKRLHTGRSLSDLISHV